MHKCIEPRCSKRSVDGSVLCSQHGGSYSSGSQEYKPALTAREYLINCSIRIERDQTISWADRVKGFILIDHVLDYVYDPASYERKHKHDSSDASFFGTVERK